MSSHHSERKREKEREEREKEREKERERERESERKSEEKPCVFATCGDSLGKREERTNEFVRWNGVKESASRPVFL